MAATGLDGLFAKNFASVLAFYMMLSPASFCRAEQADEVRAPLGYVAAALTSGNPADAMTPFDRSFSGYEKLSNYFTALTSAFQLANEIDVTDELDSAGESKLTVLWTLTLTDQQTNASESRSATINVRLLRKGGKWKIVDLSPLDLFNPQPQSVEQ